MGSFIHQFLYLWETTQCYLLDARWVGPRASLLAVEKKKKTSAPATRIKSQFPCHIARSLLFILTLLFQLIQSLLLLLYGDQKQCAREALYRVFHNVLCDYKHYNTQTKGPTLMESFTATGKLKKLFLRTRDV